MLPPVSYTHLDVYKRQFWSIVGLFFVIWRDGSGSVDLHPVAILDAVINCRYIGIY